MAGWKPLLEKAEDYPYFKGDIGFLLDFAEVPTGIEIAKWEDEEHVIAQQQFLFYYERDIAIFGLEKLNVQQNLFTRALLTFGDYLLGQGRNYSFLGARVVIWFNERQFHGMRLCISSW